MTKGIDLHTLVPSKGCFTGLTFEAVARGWFDLSPLLPQLEQQATLTRGTANDDSVAALDVQLAGMHVAQALDPYPASVLKAFAIIEHHAANVKHRGNSKLKDARNAAIHGAEGGKSSALYSEVVRGKAMNEHVTAILGSETFEADYEQSVGMPIEALVVIRSFDLVREYYYAIEPPEQAKDEPPKEDVHKEEREYIEGEIRDLLAELLKAFPALDDWKRRNVLRNDLIYDHQDEDGNDVPALCKEAPPAFKKQLKRDINDGLPLQDILSRIKEEQRRKQQQGVARQGPAEAAPAPAPAGVYVPPHLRHRGGGQRQQRQQQDDYLQAAVARVQRDIDRAGRARGAITNIGQALHIIKSERLKIRDTVTPEQVTANAQELLRLAPSMREVLPKVVELAEAYGGVLLPSRVEGEPLSFRRYKMAELEDVAFFYQQDGWRERLAAFAGDDGEGQEAAGELEAAGDGGSPLLQS
eukprot:m.89574 g.89574  ORF g.89574 m.89574 type:complete len:470 (-) comp14861_c0_seq8:247-1656(-)